MVVPYLLTLLDEFQEQISTPKLRSMHRISRKPWSQHTISNCIQISSPMQDIQHRRGNKADEEVIDLLLERLLSGDTQLDAVLIATPLARRRGGNISDGIVHAMGPHDTP